MNTDFNLTLPVGGQVFYGNFSEWKNYIGALGQDRSDEYRNSARFKEETIAAMINYLHRTFEPGVEPPTPEAFGLRLNPSGPTDAELTEELLAA